MAPPTIPMISNAAPIFVNVPSPLMARGHMAGRIKKEERFLADWKNMVRYGEQVPTKQRSSLFQKTVPSPENQ